MKPLPILAKTSHEMKNALTLLQANIAHIQAQLANEAQPLLVKEMTAMYQHTQRLIDLLTGLVTDVSLEQEDFAVVALNQLVQETLSEYQIVFPRVLFEFTPLTTELLVWGGAESLQVMLRNIIDNALQYGQKHDTSPLVMVQLSSTAKYQVIEIIDNGPGIPSQDLSKVCIPYYRGHNALALPGSGLGLAIVAEIVRKHHGKLQVTNKVSGPGVCIRISLPQLRGNNTSHRNMDRV